MRTSSRIFSLTFFILTALSLLTLEGLAFSSKTPQVPAPVAGTEGWVSLTEVTRDGKSGFDLESAESRERLLVQAKSFAKISKGQASDGDEAKFAKFCISNKESPFCVYTVDPTFGELSSHRLPRHFRGSVAHRLVSSLIQAIRDAKAEILRAAPDVALREAFKRMKLFAGMEKLAEKIINAPAADACQSPQLAVSLATKAEESFPAPEMRKQAILLYEKVASCGDSEASARASYRGALLNIWDGNCKAALPALDRMVAKSSTANSALTFVDYRSRVLFWKNRCTTEPGPEVEGPTARQELLQKFPFTVHNLLVNQPAIEQLKQLAPTSDALIRLRSVKSLVTNRKLLAIESLQKAEEDSVARKALADLVAEADTLEPEVKLYLAVLLGRADDHIPKFKLLGALFREAPNLISRASLELFYPFRELKKHIPQHSLVDDILLLSLIRQESAFNPNARSTAGALGLMQLMPGTARKFGHFRNKAELYTTEANVRIGARYFSFLIERYSGDVELALAAYNAGPKRVDEWLKRYPVSSRMLFLDMIPFKETREYVASIARNYYWYKALYSDGRNPASGEPLNKDISKVFHVFSPVP